MRAEYLVHPIRSIRGFVPTDLERTGGKDALLRGLFAVPRDEACRYPANIVIYGGASEAAERFARSAREARRPGDAIWRVGDCPEKAAEGDLWVQEDHPALELINGKGVFIPNDEHHAAIRKTWTNRADIVFDESERPSLYAAQGYPIPADPDPGADWMDLLRELRLRMENLIYTLFPTSDLAFQGGPATDAVIHSDDYLELTIGAAPTHPEEPNAVLRVTVTTTRESLRGSKIRLVILDPDEKRCIWDAERNLESADKMEVEFTVPIALPLPTSLVVAAERSVTE